MSKELVIPEEIISNKIYQIREQKVMLDRDLAELYGVTTGNFNKAVGRNAKRFPEDFMFKLNKEEFDNLIFQFGTSRGWGGTRKLPNVFTEQGVAMLSGVLNSDRAIVVNIHIMRVFNKLREMLFTHKGLLLKMNALESKVTNQDKSIKQIFEYLKELINQESEPMEQIGFKQKK